MIFPRRRPRLICGLDIGHAGIRLVLAEDRPEGYRVTDAAVFERTPSQGGGVPLPSPELEPLRSRIKQARSRPEQLHSVLGAGSLYLRELVLPELTGRLLEQALPVQIGSSLPYPVDQAVIHHHELGGSVAEGRRRVLVAVLHKAEVDEHVRALRGAGILLDQMTIPAFAVHRAFIANYGVDDGSASAVIDCGARSTTITAIHDRTIRMVQSFPFGGEDLTALLAERLELERDVAERWKRGELGEEAPEISFLFERSLADWAGRFADCFSYFEYRHPRTPIRRIHLCGGGALLPALRETLERSFGLEVALLDPFGGLQGEPPTDPAQAPRFAAAVGAMLGG